MAPLAMSLFTDAAEKLDRRYGWDKLLWPFGLVILIGLRNRLREKNLYDTGRGSLDKPDVSEHPRYLTARTLDGTYNDLDDPLMGRLGSRFGRNVPLERTVSEPEDRHSSRTHGASARTAHAQGVPACDNTQPARRRVDPVRSARLVQPRQERGPEPLEGHARGRRSVA